MPYQVQKLLKKDGAESWKSVEQFESLEDCEAYYWEYQADMPVHEAQETQGTIQAIRIAMDIDLV